jgi:H+-translocating NAD(P) transhydrogenase subunit alpha
MHTPTLTLPHRGGGIAKRKRYMDATTAITGFVALYIFMLAAFTGYEIIGRVPAILHTPLMSGSNFVHGIVVVGALWALLNASNTLEQAIGFFGVLLGAGNAAGGYVVTERMLEMFKSSDKAKK